MWCEPSSLGRLWNLQQHSASTPSGHVQDASALHMCDVDPNATIISIDGIGAFDQISRAAMLEGLINVEGGGQAIPFVHSFHGFAIFLLVRRFFWHHPHEPPRRGRRARRSVNATPLFSGATRCVPSDERQ